MVHADNILLLVILLLSFSLLSPLSFLYFIIIFSLVSHFFSRYSTVLFFFFSMRSVPFIIEFEWVFFHFALLF